MRLFRFEREDGSVGCGVGTPAGGLVDAGVVATNYDEAFFVADGMERLREWVDGGMTGGKELSGQEKRLAPVARPSKIICVGQNYAAHAAEMGGEVPTEPLLFMKASSSWSGPEELVLVPPGSKKLDYEVELAVVIGKYLENRAVHVEQTDVLNVIAGYSVFCDYSERAWQKEHGGQWVKGKSYDSFAPMGPALVTPEEVPDPQALRLWSQVNGEMRQKSSTADMIFPVLEIVSYISRFMALLPGDVIATGTPSGVGGGFDPPRFLKAGDTVEVGVEGLGIMRQTVRAAEEV